MEQGSVPWWATNQGGVVYGCTGRLINSITSRLEGGLGSIPSVTTKIMTDLQRLKDTFDALDLGYVEESSEDTITITIYKGLKNVIGYQNFLADFYFTGEGKCTGAGVFED